MTQRRGSLLALCLVLGMGLWGCETTSTVRTADGRERVVASNEDMQASAAKRARVRLELAAAYFGRGQLPTALEEVNHAVAADPNLGEAHNLRGLVYAAMGENELAEQSYQRALQVNPRDGDTMHNLGWFYCQQRRFEAGDAFFVQALALPQYPATQRTLLARGVCQARAGQWAEAETTLTRSYELDPSEPTTAVNLAEVLLRRGQADRARFYIRRVNASPDLTSAQTLWLAARVEAKLGNRQGAHDLGEQVRARFPTSPEAVAFEKGQFDD